MKGEMIGYMSLHLSERDEEKLKPILRFSSVWPLKTDNGKDFPSEVPLTGAVWDPYKRELTGMVDWMELCKTSVLKGDYLWRFSIVFS